jgi:peptide/nickel transport system permease protein
MMSGDAVVPTGPIEARSLAEPSRSKVLGNFTRTVLGNHKAVVGLVLLTVFLLLALFPGLVAKDNPSADTFPPSLGPSASHWLGTTSYGQDIFSQVVYGTRESLVIAVLAGFFATVLAVFLGVTSAFVGGTTDHALSMVIDVFLVLPAFPLIIVIAAYTKHASDGLLIAVLVVTGWSYGARTLRAQALSLRNRDFIIAARLRRERTWRLITFEVLPNMTSLIVANFLGAALFSVLAAAGLQFIGLGNPDAESWGTMLYWAQNNEALQAGMPLWAIVPGCCLALLGASFALLNYAFDEIGNPALRPMRRRRAT